MKEKKKTLCKLVLLLLCFTDMSSSFFTNLNPVSESFVLQRIVNTKEIFFLCVLRHDDHFLSPALGRPRASPGLKADDILLKYMLAAARKAGIQAIWVTLGFTNEGLQTSTPIIWRSFGYRDGADAKSFPIGNRKTYNEDRLEGDIGEPLETITLEDGSTVDAGWTFMPNQWNTDLHDLC